MSGSTTTASRPLVAVITGASSGIGEATARRLAREPGARLVLVARRADRLRELVAGLGAAATYVAVDVTDADAPEWILHHVQEHHGRLDLLVNSAGAAWRAAFADGGYANMRRTMELTSTPWCASPRRCLVCCAVILGVVGLNLSKAH